MRKTVCDRCQKICVGSEFQVEAWLVENEKRQGSYTFLRELCQSCYDEVKRVICTAPAEAQP